VGVYAFDQFELRINSLGTFNTHPRCQMLLKSVQ